MPYRHPNYNRHFDQRQGQNEYSQKTYVDMRKYQHTKQQLRGIVPQNDLRAPIKIDLGWTTIDTMRQFSLGIYNSYRLISSNVANTKMKGSRDDTSNEIRHYYHYNFEDKASLKGKAM